MRKLKKELAAVRLRGYALDREENEPGVACIGAPVFDGTCSAIAAISVSGPMSRMLKQEKQIGETLVSVCKELSRYMGFVGEHALNSTHSARRTERLRAASAAS